MLLARVSNFASTLDTQDTLRTARLKLEQAQTELSTGRYADVNLQLGGNVSRNLDWRLGLSQATLFIGANMQASNKADTTQSALEAIKSAANAFMGTLAGARGAVDGQALIKSNAAQQIQGFQQAMNTTYAGQYLFGGQNLSTPPLKDYQGGAAQAAFDTAFQSYFGFAKTDPQAANISPSQMTQFLQTSFDSLFQPARWNVNQSSATDQNVKARIDASQLVDASANANEPAFKDMMKAMVAVMDAGTGQLNQSTFQSVVDFALTKVGDGIQGIGEIEARIGFSQQSISAANTTHQTVKSILEKQIQGTESVDAASASVQVNDLINQLDANYAATGKISKLSLLTYL